jgi:ABC-type uncharacterized transport system permease subunit
VALVAGPAGRVAARIGFRPVLLAGAAAFAGALVWWATRVGIHPAYVSEWLPATLVGGLGIGLTFPVLSAAAVSSLPADRFAVGSAVNQTAVGIAILVVILGTQSTPVAALAHFRHLWVYCASMAVLCGLACVALN